MTMDYAPSLIFTLSLDVIFKKIRVDDLQKQLEDIKTQLSIVTKVLMVVTELLGEPRGPQTSQDDDSPTDQQLSNLVTASQKRTYPFTIERNKCRSL